ncbi:MAG: hypothetical protein WAM82_32035 [Thermoanaerobaculia bacterium]
MSLRRIIRDRRLSPEEAAENREIRQQIAEELPELILRHVERLETKEACAREDAGRRG